MNSSFQAAPELAQRIRLRSREALIAGALLLVISVIGAIWWPDQFARSYLLGYLFWLGIALGSLAILMLQYLTGGAWGVVTRRIFEAAARTLPLLALFFLPILIEIPRLYPWSHAEIVAAELVLKHRSVYMNVPMFIVRAVLYFAVWCGLSYLLNKWSAEEDTGVTKQAHLEWISTPGLILYVFTVTFSSVDWAESLFTHWYSTMWGFLFVAAQGLGAMSFAIVVLVLLRRAEPMRSDVRDSHLHDLGKLLLMFVMLWAYFAFSQLLIVWSGNLASEIPWYMPRLHGSWAIVGGMLIVFEFLVPFLMLLSKKLKQSPRAMVLLVTLLLVMRFVDLYWMVMPDFDRHGFRLHWLQLTVPLALGGIWVGVFLNQLNRRPLLPLGAVNLQQALEQTS